MNFIGKQYFKKRSSEVGRSQFLRGHKEKKGGKLAEQFFIKILPKSEIGHLPNLTPTPLLLMPRGFKEKTAAAFCLLV